MHLLKYFLSAIVLLIGGFLYTLIPMPLEMINKGYGIQILVLLPVFFGIYIILIGSIIITIWNLISYIFQDDDYDEEDEDDEEEETFYMNKSSKILLENPNNSSSLLKKTFNALMIFSLTILGIIFFIYALFSLSAH